MRAGWPPASGSAWVTGASSGLGEALAKRMARDGWRIAASARGQDALETLATAVVPMAGRVMPVPLDVTDGEAVLAAVETIEQDLGKIELAVLNAGTHRPVQAANLQAEDFRDLIEINLMGTVHCLAALLPRMIARRRGHIAVVASLAGYRGLPTSAAYNIPKADLINMVKALRPELESHDIVIQVVNPGFVRTPLTDRNPFPMPFLMEVEDAAEAFYRGLQSDRLEIAFPWRFAALLKLLRILPAPLAMAVTRRMVPDSQGR